MPPATNANRVSLRVFTPEEIEIFLSGDRREIDRLMLHSMNNLAHIMLEHMDRNREVHDVLGAPGLIAARVAWIDAAVVKSRERTRMMQKVSDAGVFAVIPTFVLFLLAIFGMGLVDYFRGKFGLK